MVNFPVSLPGLKTDFDNADPIASADQNDSANEVNAIGAKVGVDSSAVTTSHDYKLSSVTGTAKAVSTSGNQSIAGAKTFSGSLNLSDNPLTVDTAGIKSLEYDSSVGYANMNFELRTTSSFSVDTIAEKTAATGVTVDGLLIKDGTPANWDGWTIANGTWTYASASTITVPAGATSKYGVGDKIKWTQTTVKYGVIVTVADTLLTIAVNTDYVVTDAAISANFYSKVENPQGFPHWFAYTPTGPTNTTLTGVFCVNGRKVTCGIKGTLTGAPSFADMPTLPITAGNYTMGSELGTFGDTGVGGYLDAGVVNRPSDISPQVYNSATKCNLLAYVASGNALPLSATNPFTWGSTDIWWVWFSYGI